VIDRRDLAALRRLIGNPAELDISAHQRARLRRFLVNGDDVAGAAYLAAERAS
jgi:hypothetical protein